VVGGSTPGRRQRPASKPATKPRTARRPPSLLTYSLQYLPSCPAAQRFARCGRPTCKSVKPSRNAQKPSWGPLQACSWDRNRNATH
jgi:hypothetical protein